MEHLYIIIWRSSAKSQWHPLLHGVFDNRADAELVVKAEHAMRSSLEYAIVEGPIVSPESMEAAEARLGTF